MGLQLASMPPAVLTELLLRLDPISMSRCASTSSSMRALASAAVEQRRADLSRGIEPVAVRCENASDGEPFPAATYASVCFSADPRLCTAETAGCDCTNEATCGVSSACSCCAQAPFAYDEHGRLRSLDVATVIECGSRCHCDERCRNRVVSRGMRVPLVVFKSRTRGWGVRAEVRLERGQFVCEYAGQIISSAQAASRLARGGHNYVMTVREHTRAGQALVTTIDPTDCGNVGRFLCVASRPAPLAAALEISGIVLRSRRTAEALFAFESCAGQQPLLRAEFGARARPHGLFRAARRLLLRARRASRRGAHLLLR